MLKKLLLFLIIILAICGLTFAAFTFLEAKALSGQPALTPLKTLKSPSDSVVLALPGPIRFPLFLWAVSDPRVRGTVTLDRANNIAVFRPSGTSVYAYNTSYTLTLRYLGFVIAKGAFITPKTPTVDALVENDATIAADFPFAAYLPYKGNGYLIDYSAAKTLRIRTSSLSEDAAIQAVKDFAASHALDLSAHKIIVAPAD